MTFEMQFTLADRPTIPDTYPGAGDQMSRHHIVGQKYLQLLYEMGRKTGVASGTLERFAWLLPPDRPEDKKSAKELQDWRNTVFRAFVWCPYDLFVGPVGQRRVYDPSDGVEQQRPLSFPEDRWQALKQIPQYLEDVGVNLTELRDMTVGKPVTWKLKRDQPVLTKEITERIKAVAPSPRQDQKDPPVHGLHKEDWAWVRAVNVQNFKPTTKEIVADVYNHYANVIDTTKDFDEALKLSGFKFLLRSAKAK